MTRPTDDIEWATDGGASVTEPPALKKTQGWIFAEKPPAAWLNWLLRALWRWITFTSAEIDEVITSTGLPVGTADTALLTALNHKLMPLRAALWRERFVDAPSGGPVPTGGGGCAASGSTLIAVGYHGGGGAKPGKIWRSTDSGATWTDKSAQAPTDFDLYCVASDGASMWLAGGAYNNLKSTAVSTDGGVTWTEDAGPTSYAVQSITYAFSRFIVGTLNGLFTTTDGLAFTSEVASYNFYAVRYCPSVGLVFAVGDDGAGVPKIYKSSDGTTWTAVTIPAGTRDSIVEVRELTDADGTFVMFFGGAVALELAEAFYTTDGTTLVKTISDAGAFSGVVVPQVPYGAIAGSSVVLARDTIVTGIQAQVLLETNEYYKDADENLWYVKDGYVYKMSQGPL